jgi:hypothetical protein
MGSFGPRALPLWGILPQPLKVTGIRKETLEGTGNQFTSLSEFWIPKRGEIFAKTLEEGLRKD